MAYKKEVSIKRTILADAIANLNFPGIKIYRNKDLEQAESKGSYVTIAYLNFDNIEPVSIQLWRDHITDSDRWCFTLHFLCEEDFRDLILKSRIRIAGEFSDKSPFIDTENRKFQNKPIKEFWADEKRGHIWLSFYSDSNGKNKNQFDNTMSHFLKFLKTTKKFQTDRNPKYGLKGESKQHKALKLAVAENPSLYGIENVKCHHIEYPFRMTGDRADLVFEHVGKSYTVVEIEIDNTLPGAHQVLKYQLLKRLEAPKSQVDAMLIAYRFSNQTTTFCKTHRVRVVEKQ